MALQMVDPQLKQLMLTVVMLNCYLTTVSVPSPPARANATNDDVPKFIVKRACMQRRGQASSGKSILP
ncbi:hypothetical protein TNCV_4655151 [Trichonephila clavipes]|nr:hypothetical protein TNCV_4655151 [Trichonephila clavipes]